MDKTVEKFLAQSKKKHLERIGLISNCDEEYDALCLQIEQNQKERDTISRKYNELGHLLAEIECTKIFAPYRNDDNDVIINYLTNLMLIDSPTFIPIEKELNEKQKYIDHIDQVTVGDKTETFIEFLKADVKDKNECLKERSKKIEAAKTYNQKVQYKFISLINEGLQIARKEIEETKDYDDGLKLVNLSEASMLSQKIARFLNDYKTPDWERYYKLESDIKGLYIEKSKYTFENGHWFLRGKERTVVDLSDEEYEKICKIHPPFLLNIEEYIQDVYEKGYKKGYKKGNDDGYSKGSDDGYSAGYKQGYDIGYKKGYIDGEYDA